MTRDFRFDDSERQHLTFSFDDAQFARHQPFVCIFVLFVFGVYVPERKQGFIASAHTIRFYHLSSGNSSNVNVLDFKTILPSGESSFGFKKMSLSSFMSTFL